MSRLGANRKQHRRPLYKNAPNIEKREVTEFYFSKELKKWIQGHNGRTQWRRFYLSLEVTSWTVNESAGALEIQVGCVRWKVFFKFFFREQRMVETARCCLPDSRGLSYSRGGNKGTVT